MKVENIDAVALKRALQKKAEKKLAPLTEAEQVAYLRRKYAHLRSAKRARPALQPA